jgi:hypothetical protein
VKPPAPPRQRSDDERVLDIEPLSERHRALPRGTHNTALRAALEHVRKGQLLSADEQEALAGAVAQWASVSGVPETMVQRAIRHTT